MEAGPEEAPDMGAEDTGVKMVVMVLGLVEKDAGGNIGGEIEVKAVPDVPGEDGGEALSWVLVKLAATTGTVVVEDGSTSTVVVVIGNAANVVVV